MDSLWQDLKFSARSLLKRPALTLTAIITLAIGVGANSAIFSVVNALLIKPLPFPRLDRVMVLWEKQPNRGLERNEASFANYLDWRDQNTSFAQLALYRWWSVNLTGIEPPERIQGFLISPNLFEVAGIKPAIGRGFAEDENQPGKDSVAILAYGLWQRRFAGDPDIVGKTIALNGVSRTVIGVLPLDFNFPKGVEVLAPLTVTPALVQDRDNHTYLTVGRLKDGVSLEQAQADLDAISRRLEQEYPKTNTGRGVVVLSLGEDTVRLYKTATLALMATVGFVLLIVCANVANLMLARAAGRQKEMALRAALGASRWRLIRQLLTESILLALFGGALGILIAAWGVDLLRIANPGDAARFAPGWNRLAVNLPVLAFNLGLSLLSGLLCGLAPALRNSRTELNSALKEGGRQSGSGHFALGNLLVIAQVALSLMLMIGAGLTMRTFVLLLKTDPGFNPADVLTMSLTLPLAKYKDAPRRAAFYKDLVGRVQELSGVESAAAVNYLPLGGSNSSNSFLVEGLPVPAPGEQFEGRYRVCTPDYFHTMGIAVLKGRAFTEQDNASSRPVVIVNQTLAKRYWPNTEAIGKRIRLNRTMNEGPWMEVVGIVQDVKHELNLPVSPDYYLPYAQDPWNAMVLVARTKVEPLALAPDIRRQVWSIDRDQPVFEVRSMEQVRAMSVALYSFSSVSLGIFAGVALLLAAMGIYGVMSYAVTQRTQEIGIRMALGAQMRDVLKMVLGSGMLLALIGAISGLAGAFGLTRLLSGLLFGVTPTDIGTYTVGTLGLLLVALLACYLPARRATKVDPMVALRYE